MKPLLIQSLLIYSVIDVGGSNGRGAVSAPASPFAKCPRFEVIGGMIAGISERSRGQPVSHPHFSAFLG
jgi:hypothetical protein